MSTDGAGAMTKWARGGRATLVTVLMLASVVVAIGAPTTQVGAAATTCGAGGTPAVIALADPHFYIDSGSTPRLDSTYVGYTVRAGATSETSARLVLSGFTGGVVSLAAGQTGGAVLPSIPAGTSASAYFLLQASGPTTVPQSHTVSLYRGAELVCERAFTYTSVNETIKALANKVTSVTAAVPTSPASIGDVVTVVVTGQTGQLGAGPSYDPGVLSYAPTALSGFPASAWRLERTQISISPDGVAPAALYTDRLYLSGASGPDRPYTATYWFRAIAPAATTARVQPVQYIASGTQVKHTDLGGSVAGLLPIVQSTANLSLAKQSSTAQFEPVGGATTGGTVTYTVTLTNNGATTGSVDSVVDTLPSGAVFEAGSATIGGRPAVPALVGSTLTFYGPILVGPGSSTAITYRVLLPDTAGTYVNSAIAYFASAQIDGSRDVTSSDPATSSVVVRPATAPVDAVDDLTSTNADTAITIPVTANDSGSGLTVTITTPPGNGTAVVSGTSIVYTPTTGFGGRDSFDYRITDGFTTDTASVTVAVPQARNDAYAKQASTNNSPQTLSVTAGNGLLANDFCSATPCTVALTSSPASGTLTLQNTGAFTYVTPTTTTTVTFGYTLTDANGKTASATVTIYVSDFGPDRATTPYNTAIALDVTLNDNCTGTCNPTVTTAPTNGTATANGNVITYTPNSGFWGVDTYRYSKGGSGTTALVTILVAPPAASFTTAFGTPLSKTLTSLTYVAGVSVVSCSGCSYSVGTAPTKGSVSLNATTGAYTYTPDAGAAGTDTFTISTTEPGGMSIATTVTIVIGPDAQDDTVSVFASGGGTTRTVTFDVTANDACPGTCTVSVLADPTYTGTLAQSGTTGSFTYSNAAAIGDVTFRYSIVSSLAPSTNDIATVTVRVEGAEDDEAITEYDTPISIDVRANDYCTDCSLGAISLPTVGVATAESATSVLYTPPTGFAGVATFEYAVTKGGNSTTATVTVTVRPQAVDDSASVVLGTTTPLTLLDNDTCANCVISSITSPSGGSAVIGSTGLIVRFTAPASGTGPFTFDYTITDSTGEQATATVTLYVATAPTVADDTATTPAGVSVGIDVDGNDTCPLGFSPCAVDIGSDPLHGSVSLSVASPSDLQYTPFAGFTGTDSFTYTNTASNGLSSTATVVVTITPTAADDRSSAGTNQTIVIPVLDDDTCLGCTPEVIGDPTGGTVVTAGADGITYQAPAEPGTYTLAYRLTETDTAPTSTAEATVTIVVSDAAPDAVATPHDTPVTLDVIANDTCAALTPPCGVTAVADPAHGSAAVVDEGDRDLSVTYTPDTGFVGLDTFTYTASNGSVTATGTVTVLVGPAALTATIEKNTMGSGNVLDGAVCAGCTVSVVSYDGVGGDIVLGTDGAWTFEPQLDWLGTDEPLTYRITDPATGLTRDGTLTITVRSTTPSVTLTKVAGSVTDTDEPANGQDAGDTVDYTYTIANTGGSALTTVTLTDDKIAAESIQCADGADTDNVIATLAVGAEVTCTATGTVTQPDVDAGSLTNTGSVAATAPAGAAGAVTDTDDATVTLTRAPSVGVTKSAGSIVDGDDPANGPDAGDTVTYTYTITNTGNVTLTGVALADDKIAAEGLSCDGGTHVVATLEPAAAATCTGTYTLTQDDVDAGGVTNTASVTAAGPDAETSPDTATAEATVAVTRTADVALTKVGAVNDDVVEPAGRPDPGDTVTYTYTITNTGNVTLTGVALADDKIAAEGLSCDGGTNVVATLEPGAVVTCIATQTLDQDAIDAGTVTNVATVTYTGPTSEGGSVSTEPVDVTLTRTASLSLEKAAGTVVDDTPDDGPEPGDVLPYTLTVTNTGNVTLTAVTPADAGLDEGSLTCPGGSATIATLAPGASVDCTGEHSLTQAEIDAGTVSNIATVDATAPDGTTAPDTAGAQVETALTRQASMTVSKTAGDVVDTDDPANGTSDAGDTIDYEYTLTNTGNVTLTDVTLIDDQIADADIACAAGGNVIATMAPGASVTCSATDTLTDADVAAGSITNIADVTATAPEGMAAPDTATDSATVDLTPTSNPDGVDAVDDRASAPMGAIVTIEVLGNDSGDGISVDFVGRPSTGTVLLDADTVVLTPPLMFVGEITFRYGITDGRQTDEANVTITITENLDPIVPELFIDTDGDGVRDPGEPGVGGIPMSMSLTARGRVTVANGGVGTVAAAPPAPRPARTAQGARVEAEPSSFQCSTSEDGACRVDALPVGTFRVTAGLDLGAWGMVLTADPDGDGDLGADAVSGSADPAVTFGIHGSSGLRGIVYVDVDGDGQFDPGTDEPLGGLPVELVWAGPDGQFGTDDDVVIPVTTGADGGYDVSGLPGGTYLVRIPAGALGDGVRGPRPATVTVPIGGDQIVDVQVEQQSPTTTAPGTGPSTTVAANNHLPSTGGDTSSPLQAAAWLLGFGLLTLLAARRRRAA